jgi:hypothetical protein
MGESTHTALAQLARAYVSDRLYLDRRAGGGIEDEFWISVAGQLVRSGTQQGARFTLEDSIKAKRAPVEFESSPRFLC